MVFVLITWQWRCPTIWHAYFSHSNELTWKEYPNLSDHVIPVFKIPLTSLLGGFIFVWQMPPRGTMEARRTPSGPLARPGKEVGGPRRPCRRTSLPSGPPEPSAASPSATPSAWQHWHWWSGNILFPHRVVVFVLHRPACDSYTQWVNVGRKDLVQLCALCYSKDAFYTLNSKPQALWYFHSPRHFCQLCGDGRDQAVPGWRLQRHQSPTGEFQMEQYIF